MPRVQERRRHGHGRIWDTALFLKALGIGLAVGLISVVVAAVVFSNHDRPELTYNSLNYQARVLENGDLRIRQRIDVNMRSRDKDKPWKELYQRYKIEPNTLDGISQVKVKDVTRGTVFKETAPLYNANDVDLVDDWDTSKADTWYMAKVSDGDDLDGYRYQTKDGTSSQGWSQGDCRDQNGICQVELGWNIPTVQSDSHRVFQIDMTFHGVTTAYDDVADFRWTPIGKTNQVPIDSVEGTVRLPKGSTKEKTKAWLHFTGDSNLSIDQDGTLHFSARKVAAEQYLNIDALLDLDTTSGVKKTFPGNARGWIERDQLEQAQTWERQKTDKARIRFVAMLIVVLVVLALIIFMVRKAFTSYGDSQYQGDLVYSRDPPGVSPAAAGAINDLVLGRKTRPSVLLSATILSLASKKAISLSRFPQTGQGRHGQWQMDDAIAIAVNPVCRSNRSSLNLSLTEESALQLLECVAVGLGVGSARFTLEQMNQFLGHSGSGPTLTTNFANAFNYELNSLNVKETKMGLNGLIVCSLMVAIGISMFSFMPGNLVTRLLVVLVLVTASIFATIYGRSEVLTEQGQHWAGQVVGLRWFLTDFSDFSDRDIASLVLWDRYLVYATAFGIGDEVVSQLAKAYPQVMDADWLDQNAQDSLVYWTYRSHAHSHGSSMSGVHSSNGMTMPNMTLGDMNISTAFSDLGSQLTAGFEDIQHTASQTGWFGDSGSGGSGFGGGGGGFGGSSSGGGGGSFGGR